MLVVSIIIVNWNTCSILTECLKSIYAQTENIEFEIIIIDNASTDGSAETIRDKFPKVALLENSLNKGFAAANNQGMKIARGKYILLLNSDTIVLDNAIEKTTFFASAHPEAAVVGCRVLNPDKTLQPTCFMFPSILNMLLSSSYLYKLFPRSRFFGRERMTWWDRKDVREVDVVTGCFMLVRRKAIEQIGIMDERFFMYGEETDWCYRFKQAGRKVMFTPNAEIIHLGGASSKQISPEMTLQLRASILLFMKKHKGTLAYILGSLLVAMFFLLRVPYWLGVAIFSRKNRDACLKTACTYLKGGLLALTGEHRLQAKRQLLSGKTGVDVLCFGGEDWWYHNRGHIDMQLMRRFAKLGTTLYVNSIVMQKPSLKKNIGGGKSFTHKLVRKTKSILRGLQRSDADFWVYSPFSLPVHHIRLLRKLNEIILQLQLRLVAWRLGIRNPVIWVVCPAACNIAISMKHTKLVYQRTDRFEEYPNVDVEITKQYNRRLKANADLTIFVNHTLYQEENTQCKKAMYLDHGVDYELFAKAEQDPYVPKDIASIPKPIVGYFGGIADHKFDLELMQKLTRLLPKFSFVFVGDAPRAYRSILAHANVWILGQKLYEEIPHYGKCFDAAILPWRRNRWTEVANPIKLKEYLALGKPVVSTPAFSELKLYLDVVYEARTAEDFAQAIEKALAEDGPERMAARRSKVMNASWDGKAQKVIDELYADKGRTR